MNGRNRWKVLIGGAAACALMLAQTFADDQPESGATEEIQIAAESFRCLAEMTPVRHFYVDNLLGDLQATLTVANSKEGGTYPPGSVVQLVPSEVMVKHHRGWNAATRDWEFFELDVSADGSSILNRGFVDVVNSSGGNCFGCHVKAKPQWDLICEKDHGCDPVGVTPEQIVQLQKADPRCGVAAGN